MKQYHITIEPSDIDAAHDIIIAHIQSLAFPIESWLEDELFESKVYRFICENRCIGYCAVADATLTFFYVEPKYRRYAPSLLERAVSDFNITRVRVMTQDAEICTLIAEWHYDTQKVGCIFSDTGLIEREETLCADFITALPKDISDIRDLAGDFFDPPSGGFETLEHRIACGTIFMLKQKKTLLGCGIVEKLRVCPDVVSIGMIVGKEHRQKGAARTLLLRLKEWAKSSGLTPVAGCWYYNTLSRKSLESAGFTVTSIVYDAILKGKENLPLRTGNPPGELVINEECCPK